MTLGNSGVWTTLLTQTSNFKSLQGRIEIEIHHLAKITVILQKRIINDVEWAKIQ